MKGHEAYAVMNTIPLKAVVWTAVCRLHLIHVYIIILYIWRGESPGEIIAEQYRYKSKPRLHCYMHPCHVGISYLIGDQTATTCQITIDLNTLVTSFASLLSSVRFVVVFINTSMYLNTLQYI